MPSFALYKALTTRDDWSSDRQAAMMNMQIAEQQRAEATARTQNELKNQELFGTMVKQLREMPVLPQDAERVKEAELSMRQQIIKDIGKYNGDLTAYLSSGGQAAINNYHQNVIDSEEVQTALSNKTNLAAAMKAMEEDKYLFKVDAEMEDVDEEGNPITKTTSMNFLDAYKLFQQGKIKKLNFNGAEEKGTIDMDDFKNEMRNALDPWSDDNIVRESDIYKKLVYEKNISEEQARELTNRYGKNVEETGNPWYWGNESLWSIRHNEQKLALQKEQARRSAAGSGKTMKLNADINALTALNEGQVLPIHGTARDWWVKTLGAVKTESGNYKFNRGMDAYVLGGPNRNKYDIGAAESVYFENYYGGPDGQALRVKAVFDTDKLSSDSNAPVWENLLGDLRGDENMHKHNFKELEDDLVMVTMEIPIHQYIEDPAFRMQMTKQMNVASDQSELAPYNTTEQRLAQVIRNLQTAAKDSGLSEAEFMTFLQDNYPQ